MCPVPKQTIYPMNLWSEAAETDIPKGEVTADIGLSCCLAICHVLKPFFHIEYFCSFCFVVFLAVNMVIIHWILVYPSEWFSGFFFKVMHTFVETESSWEPPCLHRENCSAALMGSEPRATEAPCGFLEQGLKLLASLFCQNP